MSDDSTDSYRMDVHLGKILWRLANTYPTLLLTVVECVQNAIDADATQVLVAIDQQANRVIVADNGNGVDEQKFGAALRSIGDSRKRKGSLGQFGIGLISPLNKCGKYLFISREGTDKPNEWLFEGEKIKAQSSVDIPRRTLANLPAIPAPFRSTSRRIGATWNSMALMEDTTQDRTIRTVDLDELEHQILIKLSIGMRRKGTIVHVVINDEKGAVSNRTITPMEYRGQPLEEVVYDDVDCGKIVFRLYRASLTGEGRKGEVSVMAMHDSYPISWQEYRTQAMGAGFLEHFPEAFATLGSGYFEGVVLLEKVSLDPRRTRFVMSDALRASYYAVASWFEEHGSKHYEDEKEQRRETRYRELGEKSLNHLLEVLGADPRLSAILEDLTGAAPKAKPKEENGSTRAPNKRRRTTAEPTPREPKEPSKEPSSRRARATLRFGYEQIHGYANVWTFDWDTTTIVFNTLHPIWVMLDENADGSRNSRHDKQIIHLQLYVGLEVLQLLADCLDSPDEFDERRYEIDKRIKPYALTVIQPMPMRTR